MTWDEQVRAAQDVCEGKMYMVKRGVQRSKGQPAIFRYESQDVHLAFYLYRKGTGIGSNTVHVLAVRDVRSGNRTRAREMLLALRARGIYCRSIPEEK